MRVELPDQISRILAASILGCRSWVWSTPLALYQCHRRTRVRPSVWPRAAKRHDRSRRFMRDIDPGWAHLAPPLADRLRTCRRSAYRGGRWQFEWRGRQWPTARARSGEGPKRRRRNWHRRVQVALHEGLQQAGLSGATDPCRGRLRRPGCPQAKRRNPAQVRV
ncbi:MAG: hypothetical protein ACI8QZ_001967 [Chlamydiales bacterium]|jgi:hypothetical protein